MPGQSGFCDLDDRYGALAKSKDLLIRLAAPTDFDVFWASLIRIIARSAGSKDGRAPFDPVHSPTRLLDVLNPAMRIRGKALNNGFLLLAADQAQR